MTEYAPRSSQDLNQMYSGGGNLAMSPFSSGGIDYMSSNGQMHYSQMSPTYHTYPASFLPSQPSSWMSMPSRQLNMASYANQAPQAAALPSQPRTIPQHTFYPGSLQSQHHPQPMSYQISRHPSIHETEEQDSPNSETQRSEPMIPPLEGYPDVEEFDKLMQNYVQNLSPKKQDKALIHAKRAANIKAVLVDKKTTQVESAQFRFWVKKMFTLHPNDPNVPASKKKICHDNKPVAIREKLFKILTRAHKQCQHGGRDKTSAQVRKVYSWVPKELISRFVKICPTCQVRRGTHRVSMLDCDEKDPMSDDDSPQSSPRTSIVTSTPSSVQSPLQMSGFSSTFHHQNRWMTPLPCSEKETDRFSKLEHSSPALGVLYDHVTYNEGQTPHLKSSDAIAGTVYDAMGNDSHMDVDNHPYYQHQGMSGFQVYHQSDYTSRPKLDARFKQGRPY